MEDFYTPLEEVKEELARRRKDSALGEKIKEYLEDDIPEALRNGPKGILFRHIIVPDGEFDRFHQWSNEIGLDPVGFEYTDDKFYSMNYDKYSLGALHCRLGSNEKGETMTQKVKIIDFNKADGNKIRDLKTIWGEPLIDFHHSILERCYPGFLANTFDLTPWLHRFGSAKDYYRPFLSLFIYHGVFFDDFLRRGRDNRLTVEIFAPAFESLKNEFGFKPLIIELGGKDYQTDPTWWYYKKEVKSLIDSFIPKK